MQARDLVTTGCLMAAFVIGAARVEARASVEPTAPAGVKVVRGEAPGSVPHADVSGVIEEIRAKHGVPALAAVVISDSAAGPTESAGVLARGVAGKRAQGQPPDATMGDKWHIGSCTKAMTAVLCAMLVEEGKLRWDSTIAEVFKDRLDSVPEHYRGVTLEQLLRHTSGLPANLPRGPVWQRMQRSKQAAERDRVEAFGVVMKQRPTGGPGERFEYSNVGYMLAGQMAETVMGRSYEDLMRERVFGPLGMASAGFGPPGERGTLDQPRGHMRGEPVETGADNPKCYAPAGTVHASMDDWARFVGVFLKKDPDSPWKPLLSEQSVQKLLEPTPAEVDGANGYAMGWVVTTRRWASADGKGEGVALTHSGSNTLWFCTAWVAPDAGFAVVVACNAADDGAKRAVDEACGALIRRMSELKAVLGSPRGGE